MIVHVELPHKISNVWCVLEFAQRKLGQYTMNDETSGFVLNVMRVFLRTIVVSFFLKGTYGQKKRCVWDSGVVRKGSSLPISRLLLSKNWTLSPNAVWTSCIQWTWRRRGLTLPSLPLGGGNWNLGVFSSTVEQRGMLFSPLGAVATLSSSSRENHDRDSLSTVESWVEGSIIVGRSRYVCLR